MGKEIKVDIEELQKQREKEILESGQYCFAKVIIGKGDKEPIAHIAIEKVSQIEVGTLINSLEQIINVLAKREPVAYMFAKQIKADTSIIEKKTEDQEEQ